MIFEDYNILYSLLLLPAAASVLYWSSARKKSDIYRMGNPDLIRNLSNSVNYFGRRLCLMLWFISVGMVLLALARPQWGTAIQPIEQTGSQIMIVLDISPSMLAQDIKPNRLERAKIEITDLLSKLTGDEVGLVLFSGATFLQFPPTFDYSSALTFVHNAHPSMISRKGTAITPAIQTAMDAFDHDQPSQKIMVVITDGEDHETDPITVADSAYQQGIIVHTIGVGSTSGEPIPVINDDGRIVDYIKDVTGNVVRSKLNEDPLKLISEKTKGIYFRTELDNRGTQKLAKAISSHADSIIHGETESSKIDRFQIFLFVAILALVISEIIPDRKLKTRERFR